MNEKMRIAVLLGGRSNEKEISLESGRNVVYKLSPSKYEVIPVFLNSNLEPFVINNRLLVHNSTSEIEHGLEPAMRISWNKLSEIADFAFIALHGDIGENGSIQGALEMLGLPYNGSSVFTSSLCMNKYKTNNFLKTEGIATPNGKLIKKEDWLFDKEATVQSIPQELPFPVIIKPHDDGCSVLVQKAHNNDELQSSLNVIFADKEYALVEECLTGMELTVGVLGNKHPIALTPSRALVEKDILSMAEKFLPGAGENQTPAPLETGQLQMIQELCVETYKVANCFGYARIDCFFQNSEQSPTGKERGVVLEINSLPALTPATVLFHQAAEFGIRPMDFIDMIIHLGLEAHKDIAKQDPSITEQTILKPLKEHQQEI